MRLLVSPALITAAAAALTMCSCAYVGDPLPPALRIPQRIADLRAAQVADRIEVEFTLPALTTEGLVLRSLGGVDLRAGTFNAPFSVDRWAESAKVIEMSGEEPGPVKKSIPVAPNWTGKEIVVAVRALNASGRSSGWSNLITIRVSEPLRKPALKAESTADGARLSWTSSGPAGARYRLFRQAPGDKDPVLMAGDLTALSYFDKTAEFGVEYSYEVTAELGNTRSDPSGVLKFKPVDTFPPSVPEGLKAIAGVNTIELVWERVTDPDLRGYRIYRSANGAAFERLGDIVEVPSFSDRAVSAGVRYTYVIASIDVRGNESARSAPVESLLP